MSNNVICRNCNFEIYFKENNENDFKMLPASRISDLEKLSQVEKERDEFNYKYYPLNECSGFIIENSVNSLIRCPSCKIVQLYGETWDDYKNMFSLESEDALPLIGTKENQYVVAEYDPFEKLAELHFENTPINKISSLNCPCGNTNISQKDFFDFDYLVFPFYLMMAVIDLEEAGKISHIPANERMKYMLSISYQAHTCKKCERLTFVGKDIHNNQFKAVYKKM